PPCPRTGEPPTPKWPGRRCGDSTRQRPARPEPADPYSAGRSETEEADRVARTVAGRVDVPPVAVLPRGQLVPQQVDEFEPGHDRRIRVEDERVFPVARSEERRVGKQRGHLLA